MKSLDIDITPIYNSFLAACMLSFNLLAIILNAFINNYVGPIIGLFIIMLYGYILLSNRREVITNKDSLIYVFIIFMFFIVSLLMTNFYSVTLKYLWQFALYGFLGLMIGNKQIITKGLIKYTTLIGLVALPIIIYTIPQTLASTNGTYMLEMPFSYALMPACLTGIMGLLYYRKQLPFISIIGCLVSIFYLIIILIGGTRGAYVVVLFFIWILIINRRNIKNLKVTPHNKTTNILIFVMGLLLIIMLIAFTNELIQIVYKITQRLNINITIIEKSIRLLETRGELTSGRFYLYRVAFEGFIQSPVWGNGIGAYHIEALTYPHNLFLHLAYEGGLLLLAIIIFPFFKSYKIWLGLKMDKDLVLYIIILMTNSIPKLMISSYLWQDASFWMLIGCLFMMRDKGDGHNMKLERIMEEK